MKIEISNGELLDKISILELKLLNIKDEEKLINIQKEFDKLNKKETLENLYNCRRKFYEKADFIVNNDYDKSQVLEKIKFKLNSYAKENKHK